MDKPVWPYVLAVPPYSVVGLFFLWAWGEYGSAMGALPTLLVTVLATAFYGSLLYAPLYLIGFAVTRRPKPPTTHASPHGHTTSTPVQPWQAANPHGSSTQPLSDEEMERRRIKARRRAIIMASYMNHHHNGAGK